MADMTEPPHDQTIEHHGHWDSALALLTRPAMGHFEVNANPITLVRPSNEPLLGIVSQNMAG